MRMKFKPRKCKRAACRKEFVPKVKWQEYDKARCRDIETRARRAAIIRRYRKLEEEEAKAAG